jgi:hypothetical protein
VLFELSSRLSGALSLVPPEVFSTGVGDERALLLLTVELREGASARRLVPVGNPSGNGTASCRVGTTGWSSTVGLSSDEVLAVTCNSAPGSRESGGIAAAVEVLVPAGRRGLVAPAAAVISAALIGFFTGSC